MHHLANVGSNDCPYCNTSQENEEVNFNIEYGDLAPFKDGGIEQHAEWLKYHRKQVKGFTMADVRELVSRHEEEE